MQTMRQNDGISRPACGLCAIAVLATLAAAGAKTTWHVAPEGDDAASGTSWQAPLRTVQTAVARASDGDGIVVSNGVYLLESPVVVPSDKAVQVWSHEKSPETVVFDGQGKTACFVFLKAGNNLLSGVTVRNGVGSAYVPGQATCFPGGVYAAGGVLRDLVVSNCWTRQSCGDAPVACQGGGVCQLSGSATGLSVRDCGIEMATTANKVANCLGGGVYTLGLISDSLVSNCSVTVTAPAYADVAGWQVSGGGVMSAGSSSHARCRVIGCRAVLASSTGCGGCGGGVFLFGQGDALVDSLVADCVAAQCGGGVAVRQRGAVKDCTVVSNAVIARVKKGGGAIGGGGICLDSHFTGTKVVDGCRIVGNVVSNIVGSTAYVDCGGGGVMVAGGSADQPAVIRDSVVTDNQAWAYGGGVYFFSGRGTTVSNCWFSGNRAVRRGGFGYVTLGAGGTVADSRIEGHSAGFCLGYGKRGDGHVLVRHSDGGASDNGFTVRNCLVTGNDPGGAGGSLVWFYKGTAGHSPLAFEQCTLAGNGVAGGGELCTVFSLDKGGSANESVATNFTCRGCVVTGNPGYGLFNGTFMTAHTNVFTCSYADETSGLEKTGNEVRRNLWPEIAPDPGFADAASGDWRLTFGSPLREAGGAVRAWMGDGSRRRGPMDMGDGTFTATLPDGANYGVKLVRNGARPRLCSSSPDMGCFECFVPNGLMVIFR